MDIITYLRNLWRKPSGETPDESETVDKINKITEGGALPEKPTVEAGKTYDRLNYEPKSDEELESAAKASLASYEQAGKSSVENEIAALIEKYSGDKERNSESYKNTLESLKKAYESAVEAANADALKRGLARSSIAAGTVSALEADRAGRSADAAAAYEASNGAIDEKLAGLEVKRQKAMDDFNIAYTAKLTEEINRLKAKRDSDAAEAVKYNNTLTAKENKEQLDRQKAESSLYTAALEQAKSERTLINKPDEAAQDRIYQQIYDVLRDRLLTMSAAEAQHELKTNSLYSRYLSSAYYYKLYDEFAR